ncbi:MAG: cytochrome b [Gammaproteobacteria bacterium]|jgi:cytochrome b561
MDLTNTQHRWGGVQQTLHWFIVIAAITQLTLGFTFTSLPQDDPVRGTVFAAHATVGLIILAVMLARLGWRLSNPVPRLPETLKPWEKRLARSTHWLLYLLLIGMPIGGYLLVNAHGHAVPFFGTELPPLIPANETLEEIIEVIHIGGAFSIIGLVILHAVGALRHEFILHDNTLRRMTPLSDKWPNP